LVCVLGLGSILTLILCFRFEGWRPPRSSTTSRVLDLKTMRQGWRDGRFQERLATEIFITLIRSYFQPLDNDPICRFSNWETCSSKTKAPKLPLSCYNRLTGGFVLGRYLENHHLSAIEPPSQLKEELQLPSRRCLVFVIFFCGFLSPNKLYNILAINPTRQGMWHINTVQWLCKLINKCMWHVWPLCLLVCKPVTSILYLSPINHSYVSCAHQLGYRLGATSCTINPTVKGVINQLS
jgi:hypothetical protein